VATVNTRPCPDCAIVIPDNKVVCPHCGRPARHLNVLCADRVNELEALERNFDESMRQSRKDGIENETNDFFRYCRDSKAVFCAPLRTLLPVINSHVDLFADFYKLAELRCKALDGGKRNWDMLRCTAEAYLLEGKPNSVELLYAALSINERGLESYGECTFVLKEAMIGHRATVFPDNSALYFEKNAGKPNFGMRVRWQDRHKLCVVKNVCDIRSGMNFVHFCNLLLSQGDDKLSDRLIEVHVTGPISIRAFETIRLPKPETLCSRFIEYLNIAKPLPRPEKLYFEMCKKMCVDYNVTFESY